MSTGMMKQLLLMVVQVLSYCTGYSVDDFDVISISNVPFPSSSGFAARLSAPYDSEIPEFTICYRFLISSYNDRWLTTIWARELENPPPWYHRFHQVWLETG